jgi:DNA-binding transcriptional ArsR family regulator
MTASSELLRATEVLVDQGEELDYLDLLAKWFRGLDDPVRLGILDALRDGEKSVEELCEALGMKQPRISNHLACLRWCRFVATRRDGKRVLYRLSDPNVPVILELARASLARSAERVYCCTRA